MRLEARKYLYDIQQAAARVAEFTLGKQLEDYRSNAMLRSAVERQFEIIGEALAQLARLDENLVAKISEHRRIIAFRNILIHGYAEVDDRLVWDVVQAKVPVLIREVEKLLAGG
ncbi:MAG: HepT-like ribonuclease domain-containing protein [Nitrososphaerales archaeon]